MAIVGLTKAEQYEKTRTTLLNVAHELFAMKGYAGTSTNEIVESAKVTRGALYYHFQDKKSIFQAVFERHRQSRTHALIERIQEAEGDAWQRLVETGLTLVVESLSEKDTQRIVYTDGPAVLGQEIWHTNVPALDFITASLEQLKAEGFLEEKTPHHILARLMWGALLEAGLYVSHAADPVGAQREVLHGLKFWFEKLLDRHSGGGSRASPRFSFAGHVLSKP